MSGTGLEAVVHAMSLSGSSSVCLDLRAVDAQLPQFTAGAHIDLHVSDGLVRQYSLCNAPTEQHRYVICVRRDDTGRGGSRAVHDRLRVGQQVRISVPRNHFELRPATTYLLMAAGIGLTPLLAMAETLSAAGTAFELHHYVRSERDVDLRERLESSHLAPHVVIHASERGDSARAGLPGLLSTPDPGTRVYVCGPTGFMEAVTQQATAMGWADEQIHREAFTPAPVASLPSGGQAFEVVVASTGERFTVGQDDTIAEVLEAGGVSVELSCEQGMCGACLTDVISGIPEHHDVVQSDAEHATNARITICCSRSRTPELVLGL